MKIRVRKQLVGVTLFTLTAIGQWACLSQKNNATAMRRSEYTQQQIIDRAAPLASVISGNSDPLILSASPLVVIEKTGTKKRVWTTDAVNRADAEQVHMTWDATNGDLLCVSRSVPDPLSSKPSRLTYRDAVRITGSWLATLGVSRTDSGWSPTGALEHNNGLWRIQWVASRKRMDVSIDAHSGELITATSFKNQHSQERSHTSTM